MTVRNLVGSFNLLDVEFSNLEIKDRNLIEFEKDSIDYSDEEMRLFGLDNFIIDVNFNSVSFNEV